VHPTGKQAGHHHVVAADSPALYVDSESFSFREGTSLAQLATPRQPFTSGLSIAGDDRLVRGRGEKQDPANTGALLLFAGSTAFIQIND